ncbi:uncharacterized protein LOC128360018 [Scomber japonicus]|uniref:uncharacterized protein LOC128360018 n=1 Tax=Scomber japonicus TaxID=13676 RepID=UPI0023068BB4|nr:uncharacterized protein LOC128360018 [Scomber japonicus]
MVYLRNLAVSDFLLCLCLPLRIINYISSSVTFRLVYCNIAVSGLYLNMYASILFMGYIAANRYLKIIDPLGNHFLRTVQAARIISTVTWVFLLAPVISFVSMSLLTQEAPTVVPDSCECLHSSQVHVFYKIIHISSCITFLFVLVSLVFFYHSASRSVLQAQQRQLASSSYKKLRRSRRKMLVLVSVFCVCFVPYHLVRLPYIFLYRQCSLSKVFYYLKELSVLLSVLNVCLDPVVYFFFSKAFRAQLTIHIAKRGNEGQPRATKKPPETKMDVTSSSNQSSANTQSQVNSQCEHIDKSGHLFFALAYSLVFVVGLVLNGFTLSILTLKVYFCSAQRQVSSIMMVYLKNLAASDFLLCLCLPFYIANSVSSSVTLRLVHCIFASCAFYLNMYASILFMGYIAADRYFKIIHPLRNHILRTVKAARIISTVTWIFFSALMTSYITLWHLTKPELTFVPDKFGSAATFLFVLVCMIFFYYSASRSVLQAQQRKPQSSSCKKLMRSNRKMLVLVSVFCVCFVPYHLSIIPYALLRKYCSLRLVLHYLIEGTILLSVFNVCLDPVIYFFSCKAFRTNLNLKQMFSRNKTSTNMGDLVGVGVTSVTNQTADDDINQCDQTDTKAHLFFMVVYTLVFVVGLVLNSLTLKVYFCSAQQQVSSIMMVYLRNLAVSDFLLCLCLPLRIINYISSSITFRLVYCNFAIFGLHLNMYASILFMGYIAANRYLKIIDPLGNHFLRTVQAARIISTVTWVFLLAPVISYATLSLLTQKALTVVPDGCETLQNAQVTMFYTVIDISSCITFLVVLVSLIFFYHSASRSVLQAQQRQLASSSCKKLRRSRRKMLVLVSVFCICFVPYHLVRLPYIFLHRQCSLSKVFYYLKEVTVLLSVLNVCLDPFIYFMFSKAFRSQLSLSP